MTGFEMAARMHQVNDQGVLPMPSDGKEKRTAVHEVTDNSFYTLCRAFTASPKFRSYASATQDLWGRELKFAMRPNCLGAIALDNLRPRQVQEYLDAFSDKPSKQSVALSALKALEKWAARLDLLQRDFTKGVEIGKSDGGHTPWTEAQVDQAIRHARPDIARAVLLGAETGQRISDLVRIGPTDVETYKGSDGINVTQKKTGKQVWIPVLPRLAEAMATWERRPGPFLLRPDGRPWESNHLTDRWDYEKRINPELREHRDEGLVLHGLRGHCCVRLSRAGLTDHEIGDIVGMSIPMVGRYTRLSIQRDNALAAIDRTLGERRRQKFNMSE